MPTGWPRSDSAPGISCTCRRTSTSALGRYRDSLEVNKAAVAADEAYLARVGAEGHLSRRLLPAQHPLPAGLGADGRRRPDGDRGGREAGADGVGGVRPRHAAWVQPIKAAPIFAHAQFSEPDMVLALPAPSDVFPYVKAMWHYARGVALAAQGDMAAAQGEADAIAQLVQTADFTPLTSAGVPATEVLQLARHIVLARIAQAQGDLQGAIASSRQRSRSRASFPTWSRRTGTTRFSSRSARSCCWRARRSELKRCSAQALPRRRTTAGPALAWRRSTSVRVMPMEPRNWKHASTARGQGSVSFLT